MKRQWTSYVSITGFVLFAVPVNAHVPTVEFTVAKHVDVADIEYDEAYFNEKIMEAMERVGLYDDQCAGTAMDDHPCAIEFKMNGGMTTFGSSGDGLNIVDTPAKENAVFAQPADIVIVNQLEFCDGQHNPDTLGCGYIGRRKFVVECSAWADVYVHEYGHNVGLEHQNQGCDYAIMYSETDGENDALTRDECVAMNGQPFEELPPDAHDGANDRIPLNYDDGPYWGVTDITVPAGQTLTIEPGTEVQFKPGVSIKGKVTANGRIGPIRLYSSCGMKHPCPRTYY